MKNSFVFTLWSWAKTNTNALAQDVIDFLVPV